MTPAEFERILDQVVARLSSEAQQETIRVTNALEFERRVLAELRQVVAATDVSANPTHHVHAFPDIAANGFGIEVKYTKKDSWLAVGNSVFEGMRDPDVDAVYVIFGKMGGWPEVRWRRYEECVTHVRISHAPRFVIEMDDPESLFGKLDIQYAEFAQLSPEEKMRHIREYSRSRLAEGQRLWWLEDQDEQSQEQQAHTWPAEVRLYVDLSRDEKDDLRAEAALLCPSIVGSGRSKYKYVEPALYMLRQHGVFCPHARDLYSAGSAAHRESTARGGKYVLRALQFLEQHMRKAANDLDDQLFVEYWGYSCAPSDRIDEWLRLADGQATDWTPSEELFLA